MSILFAGMSFFVMLLSSELLKASQFEVTSAKTVAGAQSYICSRMFDQKIDQEQLTVDPLIAEMISNFPTLLTLSGERDEGGYAEIRIEKPIANEPKRYKFERGVIAALSHDSELVRANAAHELKKLVTYIHKIADIVHLPELMQRLWSLRKLPDYRRNAVVSDRRNENLVNRVLDVKSNVLQALVILEELERWGGKTRDNLRIAHEILGKYNTYFLGNLIFSSIRKSPSFRNLGDFARAKQLFWRLVPRLHRIAGKYPSDERAKTFEVHMHLGHVILPLFREVQGGHTGHVKFSDIFGTPMRFGDLLGRAMLSEPSSYSILQSMIGLRQDLEDSRFNSLNEQRLVLDKALTSSK